MGLPHARGGVSTLSRAATVPRVSSPRAWGCFLLLLALHRIQLVFPTRVGVFLRGPYVVGSERGLPHARGGVSTAAMAMIMGFMSSPRAWGCFRTRPRTTLTRLVFPTRVGVFLY